MSTKSNLKQLNTKGKLFLNLKKKISKRRNRKYQSHSFQKPYKVTLSKKWQEIFFEGVEGKNLNSVKRILKLLLGEERHSLDVSLSQDSHFSGVQQQQEMVTMSLRQMLKYDGSLRLYLAQQPLFRALTVERDLWKEVKEHNNMQQLQKLKKQLLKINKRHYDELLARGFRVPQFIASKIRHIYAINVWFSRRGTVSEWHYDSHDNFLCMLSPGKKVIYLLPNDTPWLHRPPLLSANYNHAMAIDAVQAQKNALRLEIVENDVVFIPQGVYHTVLTEGSDVLALNFWFNSVYHRYDIRQEQYFLRYALNERLAAYEINYQQQQTQQQQQQQQVVTYLKENNFIELYEEMTKDFQKITPAFLQASNVAQTVDFINFLLTFDQEALKKFIAEVLTDAHCSEVLSQRLEEVDNKLSPNELQECLEKGYRKVVQQKTLEREKFYRNFWEVIDQQNFQNAVQAHKQKIRSETIQRLL